jgi:hypothetical protein
MSTRPNPAVSQPDRDALDDIGLANVVKSTDDPKLLSHDEGTPS